MAEYAKTIYFIEETQNIEGSYIEVKTLFVNDDKQKAISIFEKLAQKKSSSFGLILSE
ncbi:ABC transporter substrate-binding protein [Enterococcus durans]|nr:ABC transporter substrate-binding protein [Enterococcus durans]